MGRRLGAVKVGVGERAVERIGAGVDEPAVSAGANSSKLTADERSQIAAMLRLSSSERLRYLEEMIAFEAEADRARPLT